MELWIRSQDGTTLAKIERISLYVAGGNIDCNGEKFAHYETRERALEVLNEIQNILQPKVVFHEPKIDYDNLIGSYSENVVIRANQQVEYDLKNAGQIVYVMPQK